MIKEKFSEMFFLSIAIRISDLNNTICRLFRRALFDIIVSRLIQKRKVNKFYTLAMNVTGKY